MSAVFGFGYGWIKFDCGPMGVFIAQALTVVLGLTLIVLSLALLAIVATESRREQRLVRAKVVLFPARGGFYTDTDVAIRSVERGRDAPSRAPPTLYTTARKVRLRGEQPRRLNG